MHVEKRVDVARQLSAKLSGVSSEIHQHAYSARCQFIAMCFTVEPNIFAVCDCLCTIAAGDELEGVNGRCLRRQAGRIEVHSDEPQG